MPKLLQVALRALYSFLNDILNTAVLVQKHGPRFQEEETPASAISARDLETPSPLD